MINNIVIENISIEHKNEQRHISIIRDDLLEGGTKVRGILPYIQQINKLSPEIEEFIYPSPAFGVAQVALSICCKELDKKATIFVAKRNIKHINTLLAERFGASIKEVEYGYLVVVNKRVSDYVLESPNTRIAMPWGMDNETYKLCLANAIQSQFPHYDDFVSKPITMWVCVGSGTLFETLLNVFPNAKFNLVIVGADYTVKEQNKLRVINIFRAKEKYQQKSNSNPPYPSNKWYDAKMWTFVKDHANDGDYVWNVSK